MPFSPPLIRNPSGDVIEPGAGSRRGPSTAKLCGKPLNIDVEKENILLTRGGRGGRIQWVL